MKWSCVIALFLCLTAPRVWAAWTPFTTDELVIWFDASDTSKVQTNASSKVTAWLNKGSSGTAGNATSPSGQEPTYANNVLNGYPVVRFASADSTILTNAYSNSGTNITVLAVLLRGIDTWNSGFMCFVKNGGADYNASTSFFFNDDNTVFRLWRNWVYPPALNLINGEAYVVVGQYDGVNAYIYTNGIGTSIASSGAFNIQKMSIGGRLTAAPSYYWNGDFAEVMIYSKALTSNELDTAGGYLATKYGITTTYPIVKHITGTVFTLE